MQATDPKRRAFNWYLVITLILLYITQGFAKEIHIVLGVLFLVLLTVHIIGYAKWLKASTKAFFNKKLKGRTKTKHIIICGILFAFAIVFLSGFVSTYELLTLGEVNNTVHRIHNASAIVGGLLTIPHLVVWISKRRKAASQKRNGAKKQCD